MNRRQVSGFSLVELIMVMAILGIVSVITIPKMGNLIISMRLKAAGDKLIDDLRYIHDFAIARHDTTWLVVNTVDNSYGIYSGPSVATRQLILDPSTNQQAVVDFDIDYKGVQITSVNFGGSNEFFYDWWGSPSNGGQIVLSNSKTIEVVSETGYVYEQ